MHTIETNCECLSPGLTGLQVYYSVRTMDIPESASSGLMLVASEQKSDCADPAVHCNSNNYGVTYSFYSAEFLLEENS